MTKANTAARLIELERRNTELLQAELDVLKYNKFDLLFPDKGPLRRELYSKHMEFYAAGRDCMTRSLSGANRAGKTEGVAYEFVAHATGNYCPWWEGRRFDYPLSMVAAGTEGKIVRNSIQKKLLGWPNGEMGTGLIKRDLLVLDKCRMDRGTSNLFETIVVKHASGGESTINILTYKSGRTAFEATDRDVIWEDEEPDLEIHNENVQRLMDRQGIIMNSYTPIKGLTPLTKMLMKRGQDPDDPEVWYGRVTWDDVPHITPEMIKRFEKEYPRHEMAARRYGIPKLGSGAIYTRDWDEVSVKNFEIPDYWPRFYAMDFGWNHPTAALWFAWDRENDILYAYSEHRVAEAKPSEHAIAIQARGDWMTGVSEVAGTNAEDGKKIFNIYRGLGLKLVKADKSVDAGIMAVRDRLATDKLKFFRSLSMTREEYETYSTDEKGKIRKMDDDLMDCLRYGVLTGTGVARTRPPKRPNKPQIKKVQLAPDNRRLF